MDDIRDTFGVIFDLDGVLIDSHDHHERSWQKLADELGQPLPDGFFKATFGLRNDRIIPHFSGWADAGETDRIQVLGDRKEEIYRAVLRQEGLEPLPGVRELLAALSAAGIPTAIGSSTPRANIDVVLEILGLAGCFAAIVGAEDVEHGKPHPEVFSCGAERIDVPAARCVVVEDAPAGIEAGRRGGMKVIALTTTHAAAAFPEADLVVKDLSEVTVNDLRELVAAAG